MAISLNEAEDNLRKALIDHALATEIFSEEIIQDYLLSDYACVTHWQHVEGNGCSTYANHFSAQSVPHHVALGLFTTALNRLIDTEDIEDE